MSNLLSEVHPQLAQEWSDRNFPLTPELRKRQVKPKWMLTLIIGFPLQKIMLRALDFSQTAKRFIVGTTQSVPERTVNTLKETFTAAQIGTVLMKKSQPYGFGQRKSPTESMTYISAMLKFNILFREHTEKTVRFFILPAALMTACVGWLGAALLLRVAERRMRRCCIGCCPTCISCRFRRIPFFVFVLSFGSAFLEMFLIPQRKRYFTRTNGRWTKRR